MTETETKLRERIAQLEALIDQLDDGALAKIHGGARYTGGTEDWRRGAAHGALHVACDLRTMIRAGDPELDARAERRPVGAGDNDGNRLHNRP